MCPGNGLAGEVPVVEKYLFEQESLLTAFLIGLYGQRLMRRLY